MAEIPSNPEILIEEALSSVRLPPRAVRELLELSQQPDVEMQRIADTITSDETLTARVLRLVNSALFSLPRPVSSVQQAVVLLGKASIIQLAIGVAAMTLEAAIVDETSFSREDFWRHSMAVAYLARELGREQQRIEAEEAFTAGLLHDIGKLVLLGYLRKTYSCLVTASREEQRALHEEEREALGADHDTISRKLCEKWKLPPSLLDGVSIHASDEEIPPLQNGLRGVVRTANAVAKSAGVGKSGNRYVSLPQLSASLLRPFANDPTRIHALPDEVNRIERAFRFEAHDEDETPDEEEGPAPPALLVQVDDAVLASVVAISSSALGFEPVALCSGEAPPASETTHAAGWVTDTPPAEAPDDLHVLDLAAWLDAHEPYENAALDVVSLRAWMSERLV